MSFPRLRPHEGEARPEVFLSDSDLVQLICAFRIFDHELELSLSTRESPVFRDNAFRIGITTMSTGSSTEPGGYANADGEKNLEQFSISDERSPLEFAEMVASSGYEPVWKDWDFSYDCFSPAENSSSEPCSLQLAG